jgi:hypothetical protein
MEPGLTASVSLRIMLLLQKFVAPTLVKSSSEPWQVQAVWLLFRIKILPLAKPLLNRYQPQC